MGWASGRNNDGRLIGYSHEGVCEQEGCGKRIHLGLAHCCGDLDAPTFGGDIGCGGYFCDDHLFAVLQRGFICASCADLAESGEAR